MVPSIENATTATGVPYAYGTKAVEWVPMTNGVPIGFWRSVGASINAFARYGLAKSLVGQGRHRDATRGVAAHPYVSIRQFHALRRYVQVLHGHLDMVCEKTPDTVHNFLKDPIKLQIVDGHLMAEGTTLGADNGIAVATNLAIMEDESLVHGPLEFLFTDADANPPRTFEPRMLCFDALSQAWYAWGWDRRYNAERHHRLDLLTAAEVHRGHEAAHRGVDILTSVECEASAMHLDHEAERGRNDRAGRGPGGDGLLHLPTQPSRPQIEDPGHVQAPRHRRGQATRRGVGRRETQQREHACDPQQRAGVRRFVEHIAV